jgi:hypothetical protein
MSITLVRKSQIRPLNIIRSDINTTTSGSALITKVIAGTGLALSSSTGVNPGTGDVTIALSIATASVLGGVKIGSGLTVAVDGTISVSSVSTTWGSITGTLSNQTDLQAALNAKYNNPTGTSSQYIDGTGAYQTFPSALATGFVRHEVKAGVAINKGQAVYVTGADGTNMIVGLASNATEATSSKTMGLMESTVAINGKANVVTEGLLAGLNTVGANAGDPVWLGTGGNLIFGLVNKPYAPKHLVFIGIVTRVNANNGEIFVHVQNGFELDELHDVDLKSTLPINGHLLGYNGTLWVNKTIAGWLGYTPQNAATAITTSNIGSQSVNYANSAGSATVAGYVNNQSGQLFSYDNRVIAPADTIEGYLQFGFTSWRNDGGGPYADYLHMRSYTDPSGGTDNLIMFLKSGIGMRIWQQSWGSSSPYAEYVDVWTTGDFTQTNVNNWNTAYSWGNHATQSYATQTYVNTAIALLVDSAPGTLDTLNELAAALGDDPNFATTVTNSIAGKVSKSGDTMTGNLNWAQTDRGLTWGMNTDGAYIKFFNTGDGDGDSRLEYATSDNGDEYHRWVISNVERMNLRTEGLNVNGVIYSSGYGNSTEWYTAYTWGNHASAGYITSYTETDTLQSVTSRGSSTNTDISIGGTGGDRGLAIYHGDYGRIRFYEGSSNLSTIHSFSTSWSGGDVFTSGGALNITGNTGVTIGGWNAPDAVFRAGGINYFRNSVGIGTTTPQVALDVNGHIGVVGSNHIYFGHNTTNIGAWTTRIYASGSTQKFNAQTFVFNNEGYGSSEFMRVNSTGVGIGTSDFSDVSFGSNILKVFGSRATLGLTSSGTLATIALIPSNDPSKGIHLNHSSDGSFRWYQYSVGAETFVLDSFGNLGINATFPSTKLHVGGVITATGGNSTNWNTAYGWGNNYISDVRLTESNLQFTGEGSAFTGTIDLSGLPFQPAGSYLTAETDTLATVTARGATTGTAITLSSVQNHYQGHHYFDSYDSDGNHYPHYMNGGNNNGAKVNIRVFSGNGSSLKLFYLNGQDGGISWDGNTIWHAGNDGSGSGLDADLLDGYQSSTSSSANTIALRDSIGDISAREFVLTASTIHTTTPSSIVGIFPTTNQVVKFADTAVRAFLNAPTRTGGDASGTWPISITGNAASATTATTAGALSSMNISQFTNNSGYITSSALGSYLPLSGGTLSGPLYTTSELAFRDGAGSFSNIIRAAAYPSEGYPDGANYWLEYQSRGGHHFVLNTDGGVGSGANLMDDFIVWQGAIDGDRLLELSNVGDLTISGRYTEQSSLRYKENIINLESITEKVDRLRPVRYNKIGNTNTEIGLIAEEVAEVFPEFVNYNAKGQVESLNYTRLSVVLLQTVKELSDKINKLETK